MTMPTPINPREVFPASVRSPRRITAVVSILLTVLSCGSLLGVLVYRGSAHPRPNRLIIVRADSDWDGIELRVTGDHLAEPEIAKLRRAGNYTIPFFLWP